MVLGKITGKSSTNEFLFDVEAITKKFQYVKSTHKEGYDVLAQVVEIEKLGNKTTAKCNILGYRSKQGLLKGIRIPLDPGAEIYDADDAFIEKTLQLEQTKYGAYIGKLEGKNIKVHLDLNKLLTKHCLILAKSGSGKSFASGVLIEEIMEKNVPIFVVDPHGEYGSLRYETEDGELLKKFEIKPKGYGNRIMEFSPDVKKNPSSKQFTLSSQTLTSTELMHLLPAKLSATQKGFLYSVLKDMNGKIDFDKLIAYLEAEDFSLKWNLINIIEYLKNLNIFSDQATSVHEMIQPGRCSILNLRGTPAEIQEVVVYKVLTDLFNARKDGDIPPFFLVLEEAHNFAPERSFGETKSSPVIRQISAEGRKFGLGMCVISQRPARLDKSVISQASTQVILKLTNPNDLKAISSSVEGITSETENEIKNLYIGTAMIVGVVDMPLFVDIRARKTKHGGEAINILDTYAEFENTVEEGNMTEVLNVISPRISKAEVKIQADRKVTSVSTVLVPCYLINCNKGNKNFNLLINMTNADLITDAKNYIGRSLVQNLGSLSAQEEKVLQVAVDIGGEFKASQLFAQTQIQFSEVFDITKSLVAKNYFVQKTNDTFRISQPIEFFLNLDQFQCHVNPEFRNVNFDNKLDSKYDINLMVKFLGKFLTVNNKKEVWLIKYEPVFS